MEKPEAKILKIISPETLQKIIGLIGFSLPIVLAVGYVFTDNELLIRRTISAYYHSGMRDIFVGLIFAISLALFSYQGYKDGKGDNRYSNIAAVSALGVALFPTALNCNSGEGTLVDELHLLFAGVFLSALAYMSLKLFTLSGGDVTPKKIFRNKIFVTCGWIIILMIICSIGYFLIEKYYFKVDCEFDKNALDIKSYSLIFLFETIAIMAFAISWLVKGGVVFTDNNEKA